MVEQSEENRKNSEKNLQLAFDLAFKKADAQNISHNSLEAKIGILLGFVGALSASMVLLLLEKVNLLGINIFTLGVVGIYITLIFLVRASSTRTYLDPPDFSSFYYEGCSDESHEKMVSQIVADIQECIEKNNKIQSLKARLYNDAIFSLAASIFLLFLGILEK